MNNEAEFEKLARMIKNGFDAADERSAGVERRLDGIDERLAAVDESFVAIDKRLRSIDQQLEGMQTAIQEQREETNGRFDALQKTIGSAFHTLDDHDERISALERELAP